MTVLKKIKTSAAADAGVELPKFRYIDDYLRYLDKLSEDVKDQHAIIQQTQRTLNASFNASLKTITKAAFTFNVTPSDPKEVKRQVLKMKTTVDPKLTKVIIPNMKKLESQYSLADTLYTQHRTLEAMESQLSMQFPDRKGKDFEQALGGIRQLKSTVASQLKDVLGFLHEVATKHVPQEFANYMDVIASTVNSQVIFKDSQLFLYVSVTPSGDLAFTYYLVLTDAINDEGVITPQLYISIQWILGKDSSVQVALNHEYEVPNKLINQGTPVSDAGHAVKAIATLLEMEDFSTTLGVVPLSLMLKVDPSKINISMFNFKDLISNVTVDENEITFTTREEDSTPEAVREIAMALYPEVKALLKSGGKGLKLTLYRNDIVFTVNKVALPSEITTYDLELFRDKFGVNDQQIKKIQNILNQGIANV